MKQADPQFPLHIKHLNFKIIEITKLEKAFPRKDESTFNFFGIINFFKLKKIPVNRRKRTVRMFWFEWKLL